MRLHPNELVFGLVAPAIMVDCARQLHAASRAFDIDDFCEALGAPARECQPVVDQLVAEGFFEVGQAAPRRYAPTSKFGQLALAPIGEGLTREAATKLLNAVIHKAKVLNAEAATPKYLVACIVVFGSYLGDKPVLGDLDLGVYIERPVLTREEVAQQVSLLREGRSLPGDKLMRALQLRKPAQVSVQDLDAVLRLGTPYRVVFGEIPPHLERLITPAQPGTSSPAPPEG
jgi:hypothetical protein